MLQRVLLASLVFQVAIEASKCLALKAAIDSNFLVQEVVASKKH